MPDGTVVAIYTAPSRGAAMEARDAVRAIPGKGLEGDHRFDAGAKLAKKAPGREITLVEVEAIEAVFRDYKLALGANETRRNVVTRGIALNHLVGREFTIGDVRVKGVELCEPCVRLERLTRKGVKEALVHRGGLRGSILSEGVIRPGDPIRL